MRSLDLLRVAVLRVTLRSSFLRRVYCDSATRLFSSFILLGAFEFFFSLRYPFLLLVAGPLVFGYPHLIASARFVAKSVRIDGVEGAQMKVLALFLLVTAVSTAFFFVRQSGIKIPELPYASWEIYLAGLSLMVMVTVLHRRAQSPLALVSTLVILAALLRWAWLAPLEFVGFALILHNWVGFAYWIKVSHRKRDRVVACVATLIFACIHVVVSFGMVDTWIFANGTESAFIEVPKWIITSWSNSQAFWGRAICLYSFGLAVHYFVWLKAIPEAHEKIEVPVSFRETYRRLKSEFGEVTFAFILGLALLLVGLWIFKFSLGRLIYFGTAGLHGWLEVAFLGRFWGCPSTFLHAPRGEKLTGTLRSYFNTQF